MENNNQIKYKCIVTQEECEWYTHYMFGDVEYNYHWCELKDNVITRKSQCPKINSSRN